MAYTNTYTRINWQNLPSEATALNDVNLNKMDAEIYAHGEEFEVVDTAITNINSSLNGKVDKEAGKGLSAVKSITISPSVNTGTKIAEISYKNQDNLTIGYEIKNGVVVDSALSSSSENPVQNKAVKSAIDAKSTVSISDTLETGDTIANLTINGTTTAIKAPLVEVDDTPSATSENPLQNKAIYEMLNNLLPEETVQGNPIAISDASGLNAKACSVDLLPIQDLHGYDSPWVGCAGVNKWDEQWESGSYRSADGTPSVDNSRIRSKNRVEVLSDSMYLVTLASTIIFMYDATDTYLGYKSVNGSGIITPITWYANAKYIRFSVGSSTNPITTYTSGIAINYPSSVTTYTPYSNICPISGRTQASIVRTGINQWDEVAEKGTINDTTGQNANNGLNQYTRSKNYISVFEGKTYCFKVTSSGKVYYYDAEKTYMSYSSISEGAVKTIPSGCAYIRFWVNYSGAYNNDMSVNYPSTDTEYHAYTAETVTVQFGQTVYGGTLDVTNGKLTIGYEYKKITRTAESYTYSGMNGVSFASTLDGSKTRSVGYCSHAKVVTDTSDTQEGDMWFGVGNARVYWVGILDAMQMTLAEFQTYMSNNDVYIAYPLNTPTEVTLTAEQISLLKGNNTISTSGDNINLVYSADIKAWVENQLQS